MFLNSIMNHVSDFILMAQSSNQPSGGFPFIDTLIVLAGVGGVMFAVCRSSNRR